MNLMVAFVALWGLAACSGPAQESKVRVLWPLPPEQPRVEWLGTYSSEDSFPKTDAQKRLEAIVGKPPLQTFRMPFGITSDGKGRVFVSDSVAGNVYIYDLNARTISFLDPVGNMFQRPGGMAMDGAGNLYVADFELRGVTVFNPAGKRTGFYTDESMVAPAFVAVDDQRDRVYISDPRAHKIHVFSRDGRKLPALGENIPAEHEFTGPTGIAVGPDGSLYVAMQLKALIYVLSPQGEVLRTFGERGDQVYQFEAPRDLAFDGEGNLWVADVRRNGIFTYAPDGRLLLVTGGEKNLGSPFGFATPSGIFVDRNNIVYVVDRLFKRFSMWRYLDARYLAEHPLTPEELANLERLVKEAQTRPDAK